MSETRPTQAVAEEGGDVQPAVGHAPARSRPAVDWEWARFEDRIVKILDGGSELDQGRRP